jgi:hypothetical protein
MAEGKNEKFSSTTPGIDRYCGDKLAHIVMAAQKLQNYYRIHPGIQSGELALSGCSTVVDP